MDSVLSLLVEVGFLEGSEEEDAVVRRLPSKAKRLFAGHVLTSFPSLYCVYVVVRFLFLF